MQPHEHGQVSLVLTVIGPDRSGLVEQLAALIARHEGSWLESSMAQLAGQFAGILHVRVAAAAAAALTEAFAELPDLKTTVTQASVPDGSPRPRVALSLVGHERIGIVREISQILAQLGVNVDKLNTHVDSAAMSAETLFRAEAQLELPPDLDAALLIKALEHLSDDLMVELTPPA